MLGVAVEDEVVGVVAQDDIGSAAYCRLDAAPCWVWYQYGC